MIRPGALIGCALCLIAATAWSDEPPVVLAQSLFEKGRALMAQGDYAHACPAFAASQRLDPGGGTLLNLAVCHEKEGKLATAWAEFNEALSSALRENRKDRQTFAQQEIDKLRPELPHLEIHLPAKPAPGIVVRLDGTSLSRQSLAYAVPIDPGVHRVSATAPGREPWSTKVKVGRGQHLTVTVPTLALPSAPSSSPPSALPPRSAPPAPSAAPAPVPAPLGETRSPGKRLGTGSYVSGGVAVIAFGTAIVTGLLALSAEHSAQSKCLAARDYCPDPSYRTDASHAKTLAWVSTGALGLGVAASVAAFFWPRQSVPAESSVGPAAGLTFAGRF